MLAVDTNVLVRLLTGDDPEQFLRAEALVRDNEIRIATTVLLETEWVLRSAYHYGPAEIVSALRNLARLPQVSLEDPAAAAQALIWTEQGMELPDALHIATTDDCEAFVSFDRRCVRLAGRLGRQARMP